jgi:hypothetical protein
MATVAVAGAVTTLEDRGAAATATGTVQALIGAATVTGTVPARGAAATATGTVPARGAAATATMELEKAVAVASKIRTETVLFKPSARHGTARRVLSVWGLPPRWWN